jgi:ketosteroid isomerase-like protein
MTITPAALDAQEACFARAFARGELELTRGLYHPAVVYLSPTVRLFGWPARIEGIERTLAFIALTIARLENIVYRVAERAIVARGDAAFVSVDFDFTREGRRLRSRYVVLYRYRDGVIGQQELYYDPSGALEELSPAV